MEKSEKEIRKALLSDKINTGASKTVYLSQEDLKGCHLDSLNVMDLHGKSWPVSSIR